MKKIYQLIVLSALAFTTHMKAQVTEFDELQTPASPGFSLLDDAPASIEKPTTPQGFAVSALNLFQKGGALEIAPFWLVTHPNLTAERMFENKFPIIHNLSISGATVSNDTNKFITAGIRTRVLKLYSGGQADDRQTLEDIIVAEAINIDPVTFELQNPTRLDSARNAYADIVEKPAFSIDIAGAFASNSDSSSFKSLYLARAGAWASINWRPGGDDFYTTVIGRYLFNSNFRNYAKDSHMFDYGARLNYDINNFTVSFEALHRLDMTTKDYSSYRVAFVASYKVSQNIYLTGTFGRNFSDVNNLITLVGINFGISANRVTAF